ncbi:hypothetical protein MTBSS4_310022 [Magnetospirillum sp. SS-4]|nr:hypothetical protein MTBSS4_310022 [Magnetospirillum sp. SS-4]
MQNQTLGFPIRPGFLVRFLARPLLLIRHRNSGQERRHDPPYLAQPLHPQHRMDRHDRNGQPGLPSDHRHRSGPLPVHRRLRSCGHRAHHQ